MALITDANVQKLSVVGEFHRGSRRASVLQRVCQCLLHDAKDVKFHASRQRSRPSLHDYMDGQAGRLYLRDESRHLLQPWLRLTFGIGLVACLAGASQRVTACRPS